MKVINYFYTLLEFFFPPICVVCKKVHNVYLCYECAQNIKLYTPHCLYCQKGNIFGYTHEECVANSTPIFSTVVMFVYAPIIKKILQKIKYSRKQRYFNIVQELMEMYIQKDPFYLIKTMFSNARDGPLYLIPIPMHTNKLKKRGFWPTLILSEGLKEVFDKKPFIVVIETGLITKQKSTKSQMGLTRDERLVNLKDAFCVDVTRFATLFPEKVGTIILVDDVISTGSTLNEVAYTILQNVPNDYTIKIHVMALARA